MTEVTAQLHERKIEMHEVLEYIEQKEEVTSSDVLQLALDINMKSLYCPKKYRASDRRVVFMNNMMRRNHERRAKKRNTKSYSNR